MRQTKEEFRNCLELCNAEKGYIKVSDKYGDYGIVGFWVIVQKRVLHYVFSCRVLGMGIEQFVYSYLNFPDVPVIDDVSSQLIKDVYVPWVNCDKVERTCHSVELERGRGKVLLKGRCDLNNIVQYLKPYNIINECNYINSLGHDTSLFACTTNIVLSHKLSKERRNKILSSVPMFDCITGVTEMFTSCCDAVILSLSSEYSFGVYRSKTDQEIVIAVGDYFYDMTKEEKWNSYINKEIYTLGYSLSKDSLELFSKRYKKEELLAEDILKNIIYIRDNLPAVTKLILVLGNDQYKSNRKLDFEEEKLQMYLDLNKLILTSFKDRDDISIIDTNDFLHGTNDITDSIMHYVRRIYYNIAQKINCFVK